MDPLLLINPRHVPRRKKRRVSSGLRRGPKHLGNLPPALRAYWQRVRRQTRRVSNPRRRSHSRGTAMAARPRRTHRPRRRRVSHRARRAAARRLATMRMSNPRPRRPRAHHHRVRSRRLRNPRSAMGGFSKRGVIHIATGAGVGAIGAIGLDYLWQYLSSNVIPAQYQSGYLGTLVKAATAVGAGWLAGKVVSKPAAIGATLGALTVIAYQFGHQLIAGAAPTAAIPATTTTATPALAGVGAYMRPSSALGWMSPGTPLRGLGRVGAYMRGSMPAPNMNRPGGSVNVSGLAMPGGY